jgi:hypothetical protein
MPTRSTYSHARSLIFLIALTSAIHGLSTQPALGQPDDLRSFRSVNFGDRYIRHRNSLGYADKIEKADTLGRKDSTFRLVPGLAGRCSSFESVNYPGHYLRHKDFRVSLSPRAADDLFKQDATFCLRPGLFNSSARSFESVNLPGHYIRHFNFELWLAKSDGTPTFRKDATFFVERPLTHSFPQLIDHGTELVPAPR